MQIGYKWMYDEVTEGDLILSYSCGIARLTRDES